MKIDHKGRCVLSNKFALRGPNHGSSLQWQFVRFYAGHLSDRNAVWSHWWSHAQCMTHVASQYKTWGVR